MNNNPPIHMRVKEALEILKDSNSDFVKELKTYNQNDFLVEVIRPDGSTSFCIVMDTEENRRILMEHKEIEL